MYEILKTVKLPKIKHDRRLKPNSAKKVAEQNGQIHFIGKPCSKGHDGLRYTKSGQCVHCIGVARNKAITPRQRSNENHQLSLQAAALGQTTYIPKKPCKQGHSLRFVNSNNCVECDKIMSEKHKLSQKYARIKKLYELTKEQYLKLVAVQNSSCKICNEMSEDHFRLHIDHCHQTKLVRGLLCSKCNQGIGLLNHNVDLLRKAALYCETI